MPSKYTENQIVEARRLYQQGATLAAIRARTGMPPSTVVHYLDGAPTKHGLTYPPIPRRRDEAAKLRRASNKTSRPGLIARLWSTAERQVAEIETRLIEAGGDPAMLERDAKTLSVLARTVRDLVALDIAEKKETRADADEIPTDIDDFRRALAEKLAELGKLERGDGGALDAGPERT